MNKICTKTIEKYGWIIPIHDAALISPAAAADVRRWYGEELKAIYDNRKEILLKFFKSIGITSAARSQWDALQRKIVPYEGELRVQPMALK